MRNTWLFGRSSYHEVLEFRLEREGRGRGYRAQLARAAKCQPAYLSQVLGRQAHFTPDHAAGLCDFWGFDELESEYFLALVDLARAGSSTLINKIKRRLRSLAERYRRESERLDPRQSDPERSLRYYLDWIESAVHVLLSIPGHSEPEPIARRLRIDESRALSALATLLELGLVTREGREWKLTTRHLHASDQTQFARLHHRNWLDRMRELSGRENPRDFRYTSIVSLSNDDFSQIRSLLKSGIESAQRIVNPSREEMLACLIVDWCEV